jgi:hypothetical protein
VPIPFPLNLALSEDWRFSIRVKDFYWWRSNTIGRLWIADEAREDISVIKGYLAVGDFPLR